MAATTGDHHHVEVLVIGADMAGLACASRLYKHQHYREKNRLLVLEGRDRIGGRIHSLHVNGSRLDTGANWIHGVGTKDHPNPLMDIIPDKRLIDLTGTVIFRSTGSAGESPDPLSEGWVEVEPLKANSTPPVSAPNLVVPVDVADCIMSAVWPMLDSLHDRGRELPPDKSKRTTVLHAMTESDELRQAWKDVPSQYRRTLGSILQFIEGMEAAPLVAQSAETRQGEAGMSLLEFAINDFDGEQTFVQDGYARLTDAVAADLRADQKIQFNTEVKCIDFGGDRVLVETTGGTYSAEQVVCTLPLGVLQHAARSERPSNALFDPALPSDKQEAIQRLGYGTLDKIMLVYTHPRWTEEP